MGVLSNIFKPRDKPENRTAVVPTPFTWAAQQPNPTIFCFLLLHQMSL